MNDTPRALFQQITRPEGRARKARLVLHILPLPILLRGTQDSASAVIAVAILALFLGAVWLLGDGLRAEDAWRNKEAAKAPRTPRKLLSGIGMGTAIGLAFVTGGAGLFGSILGGLLGLGLHLAAFGFDPRTDKHGQDLTAFEAERIDGLSEAIEPYLARISQAAGRSGDATLRAEARALADVASRRISALRADPAAQAQARKMASVWLPALAQALQRGVELEAVSHSPERVARLAEAMAEVRERIDSMVVVTQARADLRLEGDLAALKQALR